MTNRLISFSSAMAVALLATPLMAWADVRPDFDDDAKPILRAQPHLIEEVESRYEVKDSGSAKYPGDDDHRALPPYIFDARVRGSNGPFNLRLLIQPGPPGRILRVVDINKVHLSQPGSSSSLQQAAIANRPPSPPPAPVSHAPPAPSTPAPAQQPSEPTADTPSGPITGPSDGQATPLPPAPTSNGNSLAPPPDAPAQGH